MLQNEAKFPPSDSKGVFKIGDIICEKFLKLEVGNPNVIYIRSNRFLIEKSYLNQALHGLYKKVHTQDSTFFVDKGFKNEQDFMDHAFACSAIILEDLWARTNTSETMDCIYQNGQSRYPLSEKMLQIIMKAMAIPFKKL
jgi:hypothetical protein